MVRSPITTVRSRRGPSEEAVIPRPLRILHVSKRFWPYLGGVERYVEDLAAAQSAAGSSVRILTIDRDLVSGQPGRLPAREFYRGIEVVRLPAIGNQRKQLPAGRFPQLVSSFRWADVVHQHDPRFLFESAVAMRRLTGRPLIFHTHGLIMHTEALRGLKHLLMRRYYGPVLARFADIVVADSRGDEALLRTTARREFGNLRLVSNAVDLSRLLELPDATEPGLILTWGRIDRHKGLIRLLEALRAVDGARLVIAGTGDVELVADYQGIADRMGLGGRVSWPGRVDEDQLHDLLSRAALAAFPSEFEGFGIALLEAMAAGRPVVASDIPTHREILGSQHADRLTDFSSAGAVDALRDGIRLEPDARARLGTSLRARAREFDLPRLVRQIDALYAELKVGG